MRYPASEKLEIIRLVERAHLPARRTLETLGILPSTFYRWYDRYQAGGPEALEDKPSIPRRVWNRIPDGVRKRIVDLALDAPELSPAGTGHTLHRHDNCRHRSFATRGARAAGCFLDRAGGLDRHFRVCAKFGRVSPAAGWAALEWLGSGSWR
jgi:transposase-like protein